MKVFNERLLDLINDLKNADKSKYDNIDNIVQKWASNNFEEMHFRASIDLESDKKGGVAYKAHIIKAAVFKCAEAIIKKCAFGREEVKMPWFQKTNPISANQTDYRPAFQQNMNLPYKDLDLSFVVLKRYPTSWYQNEPDWITELSKEEK